MTTAEDGNLATIAAIAAQVVVSILDQFDTNIPRNESTTPRRAVPIPDRWLIPAHEESLQSCQRCNKIEKICFTHTNLS